MYPRREWIHSKLRVHDCKHSKETNQSMKPTSVKRRTRGPAAPFRCNFSVFATTPSTSSRFPGFPSAIETRSLPTLARSYPRRFTFYVAWPAAPFARLTHSRRKVVQRLPVAYLFLVRRTYRMNIESDIPTK